MAYIKRLVMQGFKSFARRTEIPFDKGISVILGPNGSGKCLTGETLIQLADGRLERIDSIVNSQMEKAAKTEDGFISIGDGTEILCLDMDTLKVIKKPVKAFVKKTSPEKLLKIKTRSGREIKSTKYHPFFVLKDGKVVAAKAEELKKGVRIAVPREINFEPENKYFTELFDLITLQENIYVPYREDFINILKSMKEDYTWEQLCVKIGVSYYVIKGLIDKQAIQFNHLIKILRYAKLKDMEIADLIYEVRANGKNTRFTFKNSPEFSRFFGYLLAEGRLAKSSHIWFTNGDREIVDDYVNLVRKLFNKEPLVAEYKPNCWDVIIYSEPLKKILGKLGMASKTERKEISNIILKHSGNEEIAHLLNGLYCGDGYVSHKAPVIEITTKSEKLAKGIESCLLRLGILFNKRDTQKGYGTFIGNYKSITIYGVNNLQLFNDKIKLIHKNKAKRILSHLYKKQNTNVDLIEVNGLVKEISRDLSINIKKAKKDYPILDAYCYNQCTPSRNGLLLLTEKLFIGQSDDIKKLTTLVKSDVLWDELVEVEEIDGEEWVYDLSVDKDHNFIANNIFAHNSNVSDAICFALGRLSAKSMRAEKSKSLLFMGSKYVKPAREAVVEIVFDNSDRAFAIEQEEVTLARAVKYNGQGVYRINGDVKTRAEVIETLAQAGIDPYGFNLILQGQIQSIVKMHGEERRKIIEEVAGISVYEWRKEKSLKELAKTEERLKEISAVLRERTAYLNNLEKERSAAQKYQELKLTEKRARGSILKRKIDDKKKEVETITKAIEEKINLRDKKQERLVKTQQEIDELSEKINQINKHIRESSGIEQGKLRDEITNFRAELEGLRVRKEGYEHRQEEVQRRIAEMQKTIPEIEAEIKGLRQKSPMMAKKAEELRKKKEELAELEKERKRAFSIKTELNGIRERIEDKRKEFTRSTVESEEVLKQIENYSKDFKFNTEKECEAHLKILREMLIKGKGEIENIAKNELLNEKIISVSEAEIRNNEGIKGKVEKIDICPVCQSKITEEHINHVFSSSDEKIKLANENLDKANKELSELLESRKKARKELEETELKIRNNEREFNLHKSVSEKKDLMRRLVERINSTKGEVSELENKKKLLEGKVDDVASIEEKYSNKVLEIEEISSRTEEDVDTTLLYKEREIEKTKSIVGRGKEDLESIKEQITHIAQDIKLREKSLNEREEQEKKLNEKFNKMFADRDKSQKEIQEISIRLNEMQSEIRQIEDQTNYLKIGKAKIDGEREALEMDSAEYADIEILAGTIANLEERLKKTQETLMTIGSINMRALEVYDKIKEEYDAVKVKVDTLENEKMQILKIVEEIDKKKSRTFIKTFKAVNELFTSNFSKLSSKGTAYLEIENKENTFEGGIDIIVRMAKGKYFDITSLSGGEQTLVALSLLFAIQKYKPYHFYIFDEIDAALDKRNSERLAALLTQYMKSGQYIVVTHNDAVILNSQVLYGVSMHEGISRVLSLKVGDEESIKDAIKTSEETIGEMEQLAEGRSLHGVIQEELKQSVRDGETERSDEDLDRELDEENGPLESDVEDLDTDKVD